MSQSVCSRCTKPLSEAEKRRHSMLCNMCEPAWTLAFENAMAEYAASHGEAWSNNSQPPQSGMLSQRS